MSIVISGDHQFCSHQLTVWRWWTDFGDFCESIKWTQNWCSCCWCRRRFDPVNSVALSVPLSMTLINWGITKRRDAIRIGEKECCLLREWMILQVKRADFNLWPSITVKAASSELHWKKEMMNESASGGERERGEKVKVYLYLSLLSLVWKTLKLYTFCSFFHQYTLRTFFTAFEDGITSLDLRQ